MTRRALFAFALLAAVNGATTEAQAERLIV
jgi:hypothetical protein